MIPIVRLTLSAMQEQLAVAINGHLAARDRDIKEAIAQACTPENVRAIIAKEASDVMRVAARRELERYFLSGGGRDLLRGAVRDALATGGGDAEDAER